MKQLLLVLTLIVAPLAGYPAGLWGVDSSQLAEGGATVGKVTNGLTKADVDLSFTIPVGNDEKAARAEG